MSLKAEENDCNNKSESNASTKDPRKSNKNAQSKETATSEKYGKDAKMSKPIYAESPMNSSIDETIKVAYITENISLKKCNSPGNDDAPRPNFVKNLESFVASMEVKNDFKVNMKNNRNARQQKFESSPCPVSQKPPASKESFEYFRPLDLTTRKMEANMFYISSEKIKNNSAINELEKKFGQKSKLFEYIGLNGNNVARNCWDKNFRKTLLASHSNFNFFDKYFKKDLNYSPKRFSPSFQSLRSLRKYPRNNHQQQPGSMSPNQSKDLVTSSSTLTDECSSTLEQGPEKDLQNFLKSQVSEPKTSPLSSLSCYTCQQRFKSYLDLTLHMIQANHYDNLVHSLHNNDNDIRPTSSSSSSSAEEIFSNFNSPSSRSSVKSKDDKVAQTENACEASKELGEVNAKEEEDEEDENLKKKKRKLSYECDYYHKNEQASKTNKPVFVGNPADNDLIKSMYANADPSNQYMAWQHFLWNFLKDKESQAALPPPFLLLPWINAHLYSSMLNLIQQNQKLLKCIPTQQPIFPTTPYSSHISRTFPEVNQTSKETGLSWNARTNVHLTNPLKMKSSKSGVDQSALKQLEGMVYGEKDEKRKLPRNQLNTRCQPRSGRRVDEWIGSGAVKASEQAAPQISSSPSTDHPTSIIDKFYKYQQLANDLSSKTK